MKSRKRVTIKKEQVLVSELEGFVDLGMVREACRVARQILVRQCISPEAFNEVIISIEIVSEPKKWIADLEVAWTRQSAAFQRATNSMMLALYGAEGDWEKALRHTAPHRLNSGPDFLFGLKALLQAGQEKEAAVAARKAWRALNVEKDQFQVANLIEALACYCAYIGDHDRAFELWSIAPRGEQFGRNAAEGRIALCLANALGIAREELAATRDLPVSDENNLTLPGNAEQIRRAAQTALMKWQATIERLLPKSRWAELGISETK